MLVKRYHAKDMQQAMETVIKELGSDAVILNSRKVRQKGLRHLFKKPILEVMVAYDPTKVPIAKKLNNTYSGYMPKPMSGPGAQEFGTAEKREETANEVRLANLDHRIESLDQVLSDFLNKFSFVKRDITYNFSPEVENLLGRLIENQVREELAHSIAKETDNILRKQQGTNAIEVMEHLILEYLGKPEPVQTKKFKQKIILFIGPTGVGKTTSLVKLAANFSVKQKKKVGIINTDTYRIAAQEQLKTYADILDIPLHVIYQATEVTEAVESMLDREIIFIDTAGKKPGDEQHRADVKKIIELVEPEDILLCVSASTSFSCIKEIIDTYEFVDQFKLVVTKLDETKYRGMILNLSWYAQKSLAYVTTGQSVPDDIEHVDMESIADQILRQS